MVFQKPAALEMMRNLPASLSLYRMCGVIWLYRGSLRQRWSEMQRGLSPLRSGN
jgi:hypothetical protein